MAKVMSFVEFILELLGSLLITESGGDPREMNRFRFFCLFLGVNGILLVTIYLNLFRVEDLKLLVLLPNAALLVLGLYFFMFNHLNKKK